MKRRVFLLISIILIGVLALSVYSRIKRIDLKEAMKIMDEKVNSQVIPIEVEQEPGLVNSVHITNIDVIKSYALDDTLYMWGMRIHLNKMEIVKQIEFSNEYTFKSQSNHGMLIINAEVENLTDKDVTFNDMEFSLKTDLGKHESYSYLKRQLIMFEPFSQGNLKSKEVRQGNIYFDYDGTLFDEACAILTVAHKNEFYSFNIGNLSLRFKNQISEEGTYFEEMDEME